MASNKIVYWVRQDLRLLDNQALSYAAKKGIVLPVYIVPSNLGSASQWWLHHSLEALQKAYAKKNVTLFIMRGEPTGILLEVVRHTQAKHVVWNRVYSPEGIKQGKAVKQLLQKHRVESTSFNSQLLIEPTQVFNKQGLPFKVFTPFWRHCQNLIDTKPILPEPTLQPSTDTELEHKLCESISSFKLLPTNPDWAQGLRQRWQVGEMAAQKKWAFFLEQTVFNYKSGRDFPGEDNTSYLSPHLAFGEISPRQCWYDMHQGIAQGSLDSVNAYKFLSEIGWREFSHYLLIHFPEIQTRAFNQRFDAFPWQDNERYLKAWQRGQTGYPIIDAGMMELWHTGYMHNRVRMLVASFLTKHCLVHWQFGMAWFWDTLVDADLANNTASWQWVAGCGADAAPYFRIFNPIIQSEKFDSTGHYIRRWLPVLNNLPNRFIHKPWEADIISLKNAGVILGENYPYPIVDHARARKAALEAYKAPR